MQEQETQSIFDGDPVTGKATLRLPEETLNFRFGLATGMRFERILPRDRNVNTIEETIYYMVAGQEGGTYKEYEEFLEIVDKLISPKDLVAFSSFAFDCLDFFYLSPSRQMSQHVKQAMKDHENEQEEE